MPHSSIPSSVWVDSIPVLYITPAQRRSGVQLALWLPPMGQAKESVIDALHKLADAGFVAVSFDAWGHGARGTEAEQMLVDRVFSNFRYHAWPILGHSVQDVLRVITWATQTFDLAPRVYAGGFSMGGDITVAAAGIDTRIERVASIVGTPDWLRPDMHDVHAPSRKVAPGSPDAYARYFYDTLNPLTHLSNYARTQPARAPHMLLACGGDDHHIPASDALRFQEALRGTDPAAADRVHVHIEPGLVHLEMRNDRFWQRALAWFTMEPREG